jgi:exopolysaccharide production protein ExoQ
LLDSPRTIDQSGPPADDHGWLRPPPGLGVGGLVAILALCLGSVGLHGLLQDVDGGPLALRLVWYSLYLIAGIGMTMARPGWAVWLLRRRPAIWMILAVALVSTAWSTNPLLSVDELVSLTGTTLIGVAIGYQMTNRNFMGSLFWAYVSLVGVSVALFMFAPDVADRWISDRHERLRGFGMDKNVFGAVAAVAAVFFAAGTARGRLEPLVGGGMLAIAVLAVLMSQSATSIAAATCGLATVGLLLLAQRLRLALPLVLVGIVVAAVAAVALTLVMSETLLELVGKDDTLTMRTKIWTIMGLMIEQRPWLGYGLGGIWNGEFTRFLNATGLALDWNPGYAHNGFLQIASELGIPVAILVTLWVGKVLVDAVRLLHRTDSGFALFAVAFLVSFIVLNIAEVHVIRMRGAIWILFVAVAVALARMLAEPSVPRVPGRPRPDDRDPGRPSEPLSAADGELRARLRSTLKRRRGHGPTGI